MMKVELLDYMGDDLAVVNAARVSYANESELEFRCPHCTSHKEECWLHDDVCEGVKKEDRYFLSKRDEGLIKYLATHNHWTPFAHTAIKLRVGAPVPIRTQCFKHKVGMVENEESRRYISSEPEFYLPEEWRYGPEKGKSKQGSGGMHPSSKQIQSDVSEHYNQSLRLYTKLIGSGVCAEQARFVLPQGTIVNWIWTGNLVSFANFYNKRSHPEAQKEIQILAKQVGELIAPLFPVSWKELTNV